MDDYPELLTFAEQVVPCTRSRVNEMPQEKTLFPQP
jgi:hypothetical protein